MKMPQNRRTEDDNPDALRADILTLIRMVVWQANRKSECDPHEDRHQAMLGSEQDSQEHNSYSRSARH